MTNFRCYYSFTLNILLMFFSLNSLAQYDKPFSLNVSVGASLPQNNFAATDTMAINSSGFANKGVALKFTFGYDFFKHAGVVTQLFYTHNGVNTLANEYYHISHYITSWETINFLIGVKFPVLIKSFSVEPYVLSGMAKDFSPGFINIDQRFDEFPQGTKSVPVNVGMAFKYYFKCITIGVAADYYYTDAKFRTFKQEYEMICIAGLFGVEFARINYKTILKELF